MRAGYLTPERQKTKILTLSPAPAPPRRRLAPSTDTGFGTDMKSQVSYNLSTYFDWLTSAADAGPSANEPGTCSQPHCFRPKQKLCASPAEPSCHRRTCVWL